MAIYISLDTFVFDLKRKAAVIMYCFKGILNIVAQNIAVKRFIDLISITNRSKLRVRSFGISLYFVKLIE